MSVRAKLSYLRIAPRKVRLVVDLIRGEKVSKALAQLDFLVKKSGDPIKKLLNQAVANAENNFNLKANDLYISKIFVDEGPKNKRWMPRSRGRADRILKRTSHITLELDLIKKKNFRSEKNGKKNEMIKVDEKKVEKKPKKEIKKVKKEIKKIDKVEKKK